MVEVARIDGAATTHCCAERRLQHVDAWLRQKGMPCSATSCRGGRRVAGETQAGSGAGAAVGTEGRKSGACGRNTTEFRRRVEDAARWLRVNAGVPHGRPPPPAGGIRAMKHSECCQKAPASRRSGAEPRFAIVLTEFKAAIQRMLAATAADMTGWHR